MDGEFKSAAIGSIIDDKTKSEFVNKAESRIKDDEPLYSFLMKEKKTDKSISNSYSQIIEFMDDNSVCSKCKKFISCPKSGRKGYVSKLKYNPFSDSFEIYSTPCKFYKIIKDALDRFIYSDEDKIETYYSFMRVKAFLPKGTKQNDSSSISSSFINIGSESFFDAAKANPKENNKGLFISDRTMNGYELLKGISFFLANHNKTVSLIRGDKLLNDCSSNIPEVKNDAMKALNYALDADALIVLNMGLEYKSPTNRDLVLIPLLQKRNSKGKITFFSSASSFDSLISSYCRGNKNDMNDLEGMFREIVDIREIKDIAYF